jgi:hypothetical protein
MEDCCDLLPGEIKGGWDKLNGRNKTGTPLAAGKNTFSDNQA